MPNPFAAAKQRVEQELLRLLWKKEGLSVHYLAPIGDVVARQGVLTILSLNYDNVVETFCAEAGLPCSTGVPDEGFDQSAPYELRWVENGVNLVKLHGSLLWGRFLKHGERMGADRWFVMSYRRDPPDYVGQPHLFPGIVFGGDNKLSPLHPFPDLYATFRKTLREATRLTVVGYSFRDDHVNAGLSAFLSRREPATAMTVVNTASDKAFPFLKSIGKLADRVRYIWKPAAEGLSEAFR